MREMPMPGLGCRCFDKLKTIKKNERKGGGIKMDLTWLDGFPEAAVPCVLFLTKEGKEKEAYRSVLSKRAMEDVERALSMGRPFCDGRMTFLLSEHNPLVLYGLGCKPVSLDSLRKAFSRVGRELVGRHIENAAFFLPSFEGLTPETALEEAAIGLGLGTFDLGIFKTGLCESEEKDHKTKMLQGAYFKSLVLDSEEGRRVLFKARCVIEAVNWTRALNTRPGNLATPEILAKEAVGLAKTYPESLQLEVFDQGEIERERMGGVLAVSSGSENPPRFIVLEYAHQEASFTVALVGKAVTFDSGGISLKPGKDMDKMKYDKSGGVAVFGVIRALCELKLPLRVIGIVPAVENMPSGKATRPGDVVTLRGGRTVEIVNTDAEGRLILADALDYALSKGSDLIIDIATLTGACVVALGHHASGLLGTANQGTVDAFSRSGERTGERVWQLPLWDEYAEALKTPYADFKNVGDGAAGTITAAAFLKPYVKDVPWVHLDIAGTAWNDKEGGFLPVGPTGTPVRLLLSFLEDFARSPKVSKPSQEGS